MFDHVDYWESMYEKPLEDLPWEIKEAPQELVNYVNAYPARSNNKALDLGCGTGNFSFFLAQKGYQVVGVDYSTKALAIANKTNAKLNLPVKFIEADVTHLNTKLAGEKFDFILDYKVLHHLDNDAVQDYATQCISLLKKSGKLLLVCYSNNDKPNVPFAVGGFTNIMHYRTATEIRLLYKNLQEISYKEIMVGKRLSHVAHCFIFEKT